MLKEPMPILRTAVASAWVGALAATVVDLMVLWARSDLGRRALGAAAVAGVGLYGAAALVLALLAALSAWGAAGVLGPGWTGRARRDRRVSAAMVAGVSVALVVAVGLYLFHLRVSAQFARKPLQATAIALAAPALIGVASPLAPPAHPVAWRAPLPPPPPPLLFGLRGGGRRGGGGS